MRRAVPLFLLLVLLLSACSFGTEFVVINESGAPVEVHYTFKGPPKERRIYSSCCFTPAKKTLKELENLDIPWKELAGSQYFYDEVAKSVTVILEPNEALRVEDITNYFGPGKGTDDYFDIQSIRLIGAHGSMEYSGRQVQEQFIERQPGIFAIAYR